MIYLSNGCRYSALSVNPKNWKSKNASVKKKWRITYRFYDRIGKVKQVALKGMNHFRSLEERQIATRALVENEVKLLTHHCYNPITGHTSEPSETSDINPCTGFIDALRYAKEQLECSAGTMASINSAINVLEKIAEDLRIENKAIGEIRPKNIMQLLKKVTSVSSYNHYRAYLLMIFKQLFLLDAIEINPVRDIPKKKTIRRIKTVLSAAERKTVNDYYYTNFYYHWRYMQIFFHSGTRSTELFSVKAKNVDLKNQRYKCLVKKRRVWTEVYKTIKDVALPLWKEVLNEVKDQEHYLFSKYLRPGATMKHPGIVTQHWRKHIKKKLGIEACFYSLKHSNTTETVDILSDQDAAAMNSHTSTAMVVNFYDVGREKRQHERLKKVNNPFT